MHVGMWQLETWIGGGLGSAVDLMILEGFYSLNDSVILHQHLTGGADQ